MDEVKQKSINSHARIEGSKEITREIHFQSVTRDFLSSERSREIRCPSCGRPLNFRSSVEWVGPDSFTCGSCNRLLNISLINRALRDLGIE